jgi:hypothetical protein
MFFSPEDFDDSYAQVLAINDSGGAFRNFKNEILNWPLASIDKPFDCLKHGNSFTPETYFQYITKIIFEETRANIAQSVKKKGNVRKLILTDIRANHNQKYNYIMDFEHTLSNDYFDTEDCLFVLTCESKEKVVVACGFAFLLEKSDEIDRPGRDAEKDSKKSEEHQASQNCKKTVRLEVRNMMYVSGDQVKKHFWSQFVEKSEQVNYEKFPISSLGQWNVSSCGEMSSFVKWYNTVQFSPQYPLIHKFCCAVKEQVDWFEFTDSSSTNVVPSKQFYYKDVLLKCQANVQLYIEQFNPSQLNALIDCTEHFSLTSNPEFKEQNKNVSGRLSSSMLEETTLKVVRGPPGCGKTHVGVGLLHILLGDNKIIMVSMCSNKGLCVMIKQFLATSPVGICIAVVGRMGSMTDYLGQVANGIHIDSLHGPDLVCHNIPARLVMSLKAIFAAIKFGAEGLTSAIKIHEDMMKVLQTRLTSTYSATFHLHEQLSRLLLTASDETRSPDWLKEIECLIMDKLIFLFYSDTNRAIYYKRTRGIYTDWMSSAQIGFSTLSYCALYVVDSSELKVDVVIIDEAAQAFEPDILLAMNAFLPRHLILIGDDRQLPPSLVSELLVKNHLGLMMERLIGAGQMLFTQLNVQYRMHPTIAFIPNKLFYGGAITSPENFDKRPCELDNFNYTDCDFIYKRCTCIDVVGGRESVNETGSTINEMEAFLVVKIILFLHRAFNIDVNAKVCVITFYSGQKKCISDFLKCNDLKCEVHTVDSFQGSEREYIILSSVRCDRLGFLDDARRMNVAWTRAKYLLISLGSFELMSTTSERASDYWKEMDSLKNVFNSKRVEKSIENILQVRLYTYQYFFIFIFIF